jgi:methyl-accepting chemotaxis protein
MLFAGRMSISKKFLLPVLTIIGITTLVIFMYSVMMISGIESNVYQQEENTGRTYISKSLQAKFDVALTNAISISQISNLVDAIVLENRSEALSFLQKLTKELSGNIGSEFKIHVHTEDAKSYIRSWKPEKYGDDLSSFRKTILEVRDKQKAFSAFEVGRSGLVFRGLAPIIKQDFYVGSLEAIIGIGSLVKQAKQDVNASVVIGLDKSFSNIASYISNNPSFGKYKLAQTSGYDNKLSDEISKADIENEGLGYFTTDNYFIVKYPLKDFWGKEIGMLFYGRDISIVNKEVQAAKKMAQILLLMTVVGFGAISVILIIILKVVVGSKINVLISTTADLAKGDGDLTKRIDIKTGDEFETAAVNMNSFIEKVQATVESAIDGINETVSAGEELSATSSTLSANIQTQTEKVDQSSTLVNEVAANLDKTEELAVTTTEVLEAGRDSLRELVDDLNIVVDKIISDSDSQLEMAENMQNLNSQAVEIQGVLNVISDIADQTNLLALNASIEAARAGEHGRGFAVVADEVRKLAERTQSSLTDINSITMQIVNGIGSAHDQINEVSESMKGASESSKGLVAKADETSQKLDDTVSVSSEVVNMSTYIATKTKEMISAMEEVTQISLENKYAGENVEQVAESLSEKSAEVSMKLNKFKV